MEKFLLNFQAIGQINKHQTSVFLGLFSKALLSILINGLGYDRSRKVELKNQQRSPNSNKLSRGPISLWDFKFLNYFTSLIVYTWEGFDTDLAQWTLPISNSQSPYLELAFLRTTWADSIGNLEGHSDATSFTVSSFKIIVVFVRLCLMCLNLLQDVILYNTSGSRSTVFW